MLYMIGIGLNDEKDITVKGLGTVKKADYVYLDAYTSLLQCTVKDLEEFYGKPIIVSDRKLVENENQILERAKTNKVAFLVIGDVFAATTHIGLYNEARKLKIPVEVINNTSVINAISITGLEMYKFGKITSIPYENKDVKTPYEVLINNSKLGLHTLFLLDIDYEKQKFMSVSEAIEYLLNIADKEYFSEKTICVGCARLGSNDFQIKSGPADSIKKVNFGKFPHCLIIPGELHFVEEESLEMWK